MQMKKYRMPYETFECAHTRIIRKTKPPEFLDPEYYVRAHFKNDAEGNGPFFLNAAGRREIIRQGPFRPPYYLAENELIDIHKGKRAFIICPGPSLEHFRLPPRPKGPIDCITMAVNSAGLAGLIPECPIPAIRETYWVICESGYMRWLLTGRRWKWAERTFLTTARCAIFMRRAHVKVKRVYVTRWEEEFVVPPRTPAVSISNAMVGAWELGCSEIYLVGFDQSKPNGQPYATGLPHTPKGAMMPYDDQIRAMAQFQLPDFKIYNGSPHTKDSMPFEYMPYEEITRRLEESYGTRPTTAHV